MLRGWAVVLQPAPRADGDELELAKINGGRYVKHFLDIDGLGIRDLCVHGDDLLILAGPSMDLDGPVRVYRWRGAADLQATDVVHRDELVREIDLPYGEGDDHAEGMILEISCGPGVAAALICERLKSGRLLATDRSAVAVAWTIQGTPLMSRPAG